MAVTVLMGIAVCTAIAMVGRRYRASLAKIVTALVSAITVAAVAFVPAASAAGSPQAPLFITNATVTATAGSLVKLTSTGGSGNGAVTYKATGAGCVVNNAKSTLTSTAVTKCSVVATKAASNPFAAASSAAVVFTFVGKPQAPLSISNSSFTALIGATVTLTAKGGSGNGSVSFSVTGTSCSLNAKKSGLSASAMTNCAVVATKAGSGLYASISSAPATFTFVPAKFEIVNAVHAGTVGTPLTVVALGGSAKGTAAYAATGTGCTIDAKSGVLNASQATTCSVTATLLQGSKKVATAAAVNFTFTAENPTVANPDVATLVSVSGTKGAQINNTANGDTQFINQYFNNTDHWYVNYLPAGAQVKLTWHVNGSNHLPLAHAAVTLLSNLSYSCAAGVTWSTDSLNVYPACGGGAQGQLSGTTDGLGNVSFTLTNTNVLGGAAPADMKSTDAIQANESSTYPWTDLLLQVGSDVYTGDPVNTINQATDRVDFIVIPTSGSGSGVDSPTVKHPDVASLTSVTGTTGSQIDDTANGDNYFINQYYNANDHWYGNYVKDGAKVTMTWHVNGSNGKPLANAPVSLLSNLAYSCAKGITWDQAGLNQYAGCGNGTQGQLSGTTDASGNVSFTITNTNTDTGSAPSDTTTTGGMEKNEGPFSWTDMVLQVGADVFTGDPASQVTQQTDRVDFILIPNASTGPSGPSYATPDVAALTGVTGIDNAAPLDMTSNGDGWFINSYYSPGDHWNFSYVPAGGTINVTWQVKDYQGNPVANSTVTLLTGFAGAGSHWTASGMDSNGWVSGTTDSSGNVTFTVTNSDSAPKAGPADLTDPWKALTLEGTNPWTRMALVIGTPVANANLPAGDGAVGSATDVITAGSAFISQVNQATDLPDFIVVPSI